MIHTFGNVPVPYTVAWSAEDSIYVALCREAKGYLAIYQSSAPGEGQPRFQRPHYERQREVITKGLCDLCAKTLTSRTKVSLSEARVEIGGDGQQAVLQAEPLLHKECAAESMRYCPHLKRSIKSGRLNVRQVSKYRVQFAAMTREWLEHEVPDYVWEPSNQVIGYAKVELQRWIDRDLDWLMSDSGLILA